MYPTVTNFLMVDIACVGGGDSEAARQHLKADGILARQMGAYGLPSCLRISVGTEDEMRVVVDALASYLG